MRNKNDNKFISSVFKIGSAFTLKIFGTGFSFITSIIISRTFSSAGTGIYSLSNSIISICSIIAKFGLDLALIKYISIDYSNGYHGNIKKTLRSTLTLTISIAIALALLCCLSSNFLSEVFKKPDLGRLLKIMIWVLIPSTFSMAFMSLYKGIKHINLGLFYESVAMHAIFVLLLIISIFVFKYKELESIGIAYLFASLIVAFSHLYFWKRFSSQMNSNVSEEYSFQPVITTAIPLLLVNSTNYILGATDTLMLGLWTTSSDVGVYNVATKITLMFSMLLSAINALLGPRIAVLYTNANLDELAKLIKKASRLMLLAALVLCSLLFIFAKYILSIWGTEFVNGVNILYVSLVGQFFVLATGPLATVLMMCGLEKIHRNNTILCALLNVFLNYILIHSMGVLGAATATAICLIVKNIYCMYAVKKHLGFFCY